MDEEYVTQITTPDLLRAQEGTSDVIIVVREPITFVR